MSEGLRTMGPRSLWSAKDSRAADQVAARAESLSSMACSLRALAAMSSMARRCDGRSAERRWPTWRAVVAGEEEEAEAEAEATAAAAAEKATSSPSAKGIGGSGSSPCCCCDRRALTSPQCLLRIALCASSARRGTRAATRSTDARQSAYAGHSFRVLGSESAAAWNPATRSAISAVASKTSTAAGEGLEEEESAPLLP